MQNRSQNGEHEFVSSTTPLPREGANKFICRWNSLHETVAKWLEHEGSSTWVVTFQQGMTRWYTVLECVRLSTIFLEYQR